MSPQPLLSVSGLTKRFGNLVAVSNVDMVIHPGEIVGLIGPNGAGKTTFFNTITGLHTPEEGKVRFKDTDITGMLAHKICKLGMSRTFQVTKSFGILTVAETVRVGAYNRRDEQHVLEKVDEVIAFCGLEDVRDEKCADLSLALSRRIELARAIATEPDLLLLDEAGAGLTAPELDNLMDILRKLNLERGVTFCVVEHVMRMVMGICQRIVVLDAGEVIAEGSPAEIANNSRVIEAYLGARAIQ